MKGNGSGMERIGGILQGRRDRKVKQIFGGG